MKSNYSKGKKGEGIAAEYLARQGYSIIDRNWRCPAGEIDIVARQDRYICFVEVKFRNTLSHGAPAEAVNGAKKEKLLKVARYYIASNDIGNSDLRFDVVCIFRDSVRLIKNAFGE